MTLGDVERHVSPALVSEARQVPIGGAAGFALHQTALACAVTSLFICPLGINEQHDKRLVVYRETGFRACKSIDRDVVQALQSGQAARLFGLKAARSGSGTRAADLNRIPVGDVVLNVGTDQARSHVCLPS
jgi:hypothetical protein